MCQNQRPALVYFTKITINKIIPVSLALKLSQQLLQLASMLKVSKSRISSSQHGMLVELTKSGYFGVTTFTNMSERYFWIKFEFQKRFLPCINCCEKCIDLRLFSKHLAKLLLRSLRSKDV